VFFINPAVFISFLHQGLKVKNPGPEDQVFHVRIKRRAQIKNSQMIYVFE